MVYCFYTQGVRMRVVGVIAEYNPLHNGHIYHLERAKALSNADFCIVVLSGNFVQRGEAACMDKYTRAGWAVKAGADLVLELPSVYAVASAERFALGGVRTLLSAGVVTDLAFGCEATDVETLYRLCEVLVSEPPSFRSALHRHLSMGKSYPRARYDALADIGVPEDMLLALTQPNNILAIEYLRALGTYAPEIRPVPVTRIGGGYHTETLTGTYSSASAIRKALLSGDESVLDAMPSFVGGAMLYDPQFPIRPEAVGPLVLYAIRSMSAKSLAELPDVSEGFENILARAARKCETLDAFYESVKSKRFTLARCRRIGLCAMLGITNEQVHSTVRDNRSEYLKVLAMASGARSLLSEITKRPHAPLILRNADIPACPAIVQRNLTTDAFSTDVLAIATQNEMHRDSEGPLIL